MALSTTHDFKFYTGNGSTTEFPIDFQFGASSELVVTLISALGVEAVKTISTHYTVSGGGTPNPATGAVTMLVAPASGEKLLVQRATPLAQSTVHTNNDSFPAKTVEGAYDARARVEQENRTLGLRALKKTMADYAGNVSGYNAGGERIKNVANGSEATDVVTKQQLDAAFFAGSAELSDYPSRDGVEDIEIPVVRTFFRTAGFHAPGDGGDALYKLAASEPSHDGKVQSADGAWWEIAGTEGRPEQFGAKGDGSTDDTEAIQSALDVFKVLRFWAGKTYKVSDALVLGTGHRLFGHGALLRATASPSNAQALVHWGIFYASEKQDIVIDGFKFDNTDMTAAPSGASTIRTIFMSRCDNVIIQNNSFATSGGATALRGCTKFAVLNNYVLVDSMPTNADGIIDQWGQNGSDIFDFTIAHNVIDGNGEARWGILINGLETGGNIYDARDFRVTANVVRSCDLDAIWIGGNVSGAGAEARNGTVSDNVFEACRKGIAISDARDIAVTGNTLKDCVNVGIHLFTNTTFGGSAISIVGNNFPGGGSPAASEIAIWLEDATDCFVANNNLDDSTFVTGITLGADTERNVCVGNRIASDIATKFASSSSYLTNVLSGANYTPTLTGTTNVTGVTNGVCWYTYDQGRVTVYFAIFIEPASAASTVVTISLPVARGTNFSAGSVQGAIFGNGSAGFINGIVQESAATIQASFTAANTNNAKYTGYFSYPPS